MIYKPGYYLDMPMSEYHKSTTGVSKSNLSKLLTHSPKNFRHWRDKSSKSSIAMEFGTAAHTLILEPEVFYKEYFMAPQDVRRNTKAWKELVGAHGNREGIKENDWNSLHKIRESIENHKFGKRLIDGKGAVESSGVWVDEETGITCKCRPDKLNDSMGSIVDVKTARDIRPVNFMYDSAKLKYHMSTAMTLAGMKALDLPYDHYIFLVIEKDPPHEVVIYTHDIKAYRQGREEVELALKILKECQDTDIWPGYAEEEIIELFLPKYYK